MPSLRGEWETQQRRQKLLRMAEVLARDNSLSWDGLAERFGLPQHEWEAWRQALRRIGVRPPPPGDGLSSLAGPS